MAGHLALLGFRTRLWNRSRERTDHVSDRGGIELEGVIEGFGQVELATDDIAAAIDGADRRPMSQRGSWRLPCTPPWP